MVGLRQYPHFLYIYRAAQAQQNENGSFEAGTQESWELFSICREEPNGKGATIQVADSQALVFAALVQLPAGLEQIPEGTKVAVTAFQVQPEMLRDEGWRAESTRTGLLRITGTVAKYDRGQLHNRCWL